MARTCTMILSKSTFKCSFEFVHFVTFYNLRISKLRFFHSYHTCSDFIQNKFQVHMKIVKGQIERHHP